MYRIVLLPNRLALDGAFLDYVIVVIIQSFRPLECFIALRAQIQIVDIRLIRGNAASLATVDNAGQLVRNPAYRLGRALPLMNAGFAFRRVRRYAFGGLPGFSLASLAGFS